MAGEDFGHDFSVWVHSQVRGPLRGLGGVRVVEIKAGLR